ncbi:transmembrane protein 131-like [Anneissia japonica]|uniref:transmembrane protein 131-like n=1 Tax=Anneissia japonica TaxID=1529436 RepID=UPI0014256B4F|nr:transmembrane protein 131-like [Anneissia japonica]
MAGCYTQGNYGNGMLQIRITVFISLIQIFNGLLDTTEAQTQTFVQSELNVNELRQLVEEVSLRDDLKHSSSYNNIGLNLIRMWGLDLKVSPQMLDFGNHPIGMPHVESVTIYNSHPDSTVKLNTISGSTPHFHCSFFRDKEVAVGGNTTFDVVFLARMAGNVENTIFIHTNMGIFSYQVFGVGIPNPYRLRPFLGAKVPLNYTYSPLINMHNPYGTVLQVTEIYSSGGDLHLELPTGTQETSNNLWEIPPYQTRSVMRASFVGRTESNHTAFIRIRANHTVEDNDFLMLPVEVEVSAAPGIYSALEMLDFGTLRSLDEPRIIPLYLLNTSPKTVQIVSISLMRANEAVTVDFKPMGLKPSDKHVRVASLTFQPLKANKSRSWSGKIIVKTKDKNQKLVLPYQALVLPGTLGYNKNSTLFHLGKEKESVVRDLPLTNLFNFTLMVNEISVAPEAQGIFKIENFEDTISIPPQETDTSVSLRFLPEATNYPMSSILRLGTNASVFTAPVISYTGKLKYLVNGLNETQINFGSLSLEEERAMQVTIINDNPVEVAINYINGSLPDCDVKIQLLGIAEGDPTKTNIGDQASSENIYPVVLPPNHYAVFQVLVVAASEQGTFVSALSVETKYQQLTIPMTIRTLEGCLVINPESIKLKTSFPGLVVSQSISVTNNFGHVMQLENIDPDPPDARFYHRLPKKVNKVLVPPRNKTKVGRIVFDIRRQCGNSCYIGMPIESRRGLEWKNSLILDSTAGDLDLDYYEPRWSSWLGLYKSTKYKINTTMNFNSNLVHNLRIPVKVELSWPRIVHTDTVTFPHTYIGSTSSIEVNLQNPSNYLLIVQVVPISDYPAPEMMRDILRKRFKNEKIEIDDPYVFYLQDVKEKDSPGRCLLKHQSAIENAFGVLPNSSVLTLSLKAHENITINLGFRPTDHRERISLILIRNNMTIMDGFVVKGTGARGELRLNGRVPNSNSNLLFELKPAHLADCNKTNVKGKTPNFTVGKTFKLTNEGLLPLPIRTFRINGHDCEGFGFRVRQCQKMDLAPGDTPKIDIAFTPDFCMSRVTRTLTVVIEDGTELDYTLIATLPPHLLSSCAAVIPRPHWESLLYLVTAILMNVLFLGVLMASYLESLRFSDLVPTQFSHTNGEVDQSKRFDLRNVNGAGAVNTNKQNNNSLLATIKKKLGYGRKTHSPPPPDKPSSPVDEVANNTRRTDNRNSNSRKIHPEKDRVKNNLGRGSRHHRLGSDQRNNDSPSEHYTRRGRSARHRYHENRYEQNNPSPGTQDIDFEEQTLILNDQDIETNAVSQETYVYDYSITQNEQHNTLSKASKRKSRMHHRTVDLDEGIIPVHSQELEVDHVCDDSSSTTTENSADSELSDKPKNYADLDEIHLTAPAMDCQNHKASKKEKSTKAEETKFESIKRNKSRRHTRAFNGDVCRPSTLELPYTTPLEARKRQHKPTATALKESCTSPHAIAAKITAQATKKNIRLQLAKNKAEKARAEDTASTCSSSDLDKDSPPPLWDQAKPMPHDGDSSLMQLAVQTMEADLLLAPARACINSHQKASPNPSTSRSNSYSSVVSSGSSDSSSNNITPSSGNRKSKQKLGKSHSAPDKSLSAFTPVGEKGNHPGAIGSKTLPARIGYKIGHWAMDNQSSGSDSPSSPSMFSLPSGSPITPLTKSPPPATFGPAAFPFGEDSSNFGPHWDASLKAPGVPKPRKKREGSLDNWPGFGTNTSPTSSGLWEPNSYSNSQNTTTWSTGAHSPNTSPSSNSLFSQSNTNSPWNNPTPSRNMDSRWQTGNPLLFPSSIWSSTANDSPLLDRGVLGIEQPDMPEPQQPASYNPFNSSLLSNLWSYPRTGSTWSSSNKKEEK